jgi:hypothetical protein
MVYLHSILRIETVSSSETLVNVKAKVKLFPPLNWHHTMRKNWGVAVQLHAFLTSALDGDD